MSDVRPGAIYCEEAYAQGKMLDHSAWYGRLPRKIRPSDVDFFFDNAGTLLLCELSSKHQTWNELDIGQRRAYESFCKFGIITAVLLKHSVETTRQINTAADIDTFQTMFFERGQCVQSQLYAGNKWEPFVLAWFKDAANTRAFLAKSIDSTRQPPVGYEQSPTAPTPEELKDPGYYVSPNIYKHKVQPEPLGRNRPTSFL